MKGKTSASAKANYSRYATENRATKNRAARLARHMKRHPKDEQTAKAAKRPLTMRSASGTKGNFPEAKHMIYDGAGQPLGNIATFELVLKNKAK